MLILVFLFYARYPSLFEGKAPKMFKEETYVFPIHAAISASLISCSSSLTFLTGKP